MTPEMALRAITRICLGEAAPERVTPELAVEVVWKFRLVAQGLADDLCDETVLHTASGRVGRRVQQQRRFGVDGSWVVWDTHSRRPTWHPDRALRGPSADSEGVAS